MTPKRKGRYGPREKKTSIKNSIGRVILAAMLLIVQFYWLFAIMWGLVNKYPILSVLVEFFALLLVVAINENNSNVSMKVPIIILILAAPFIGVLLLVVLEISSNTWRIRRRFTEISSEVTPFLKRKKDLLGEIGKDSRRAKNIFRYLKDYAGYPSYDDTDIKFFPEAYLALDDMIKDLKKAEDFIFMEYHAIEHKESFARIHEVLKKKAEEGVEVRILYDDIGSFVFINHDFIKLMERDGIKARVFNPMMPVFNLFINNRDHRKYTIIDGRVAYTGGFNIANEYFNVTSPYGYWKDTGVRIEGPAVDNITSMFLEMWGVSRKKGRDTDYGRYFNKAKEQKTERGYICPYADSPIDDEPTGENVYMTIINTAEDYVWFITPYLILTGEITRAFQLAAQRGVDVRVIVPGIPDKRIINLVTKSYYSELAKYNVRIYEYTPGFCHAKMGISDDVFATCGTINLDYRSFYHHFENGVLIYNNEVITDIKRDFSKTFNECREVTERYKKTAPGLVRLANSILRLAAPFL